MFIIAEDNLLAGAPNPEINLPGVVAEGVKRFNPDGNVADYSLR